MLLELFWHNGSLAYFMLKKNFCYIVMSVLDFTIEDIVEQMCGKYVIRQVFPEMGRLYVVV